MTQRENKMDWNKGIEYAQLVEAAYQIQPDNLDDSAGLQVMAGGRAYTVVTTIYANDLATDMSPLAGSRRVSIGLVLQADDSGDVAVAIRGTEGILEWVHDAEFLLVPCPILPGSGHTEDGFTLMYQSLDIGTSSGSPSLAQALDSLPYPNPVTSMTICGHSLGGALATLLGLDVAANTRFKDTFVYTYASPRTGDPEFSSTFNQVIKHSFRIANRLDLVPKLPFPPLYEHVNPRPAIDLNPVQLFPPKFLVKAELACEHALNTYLYLMSLNAGNGVIPLKSECTP